MSPAVSSVAGLRRHFYFINYKFNPRRLLSLGFFSCLLIRERPLLILYSKAALCQEGRLAAIYIHINTYISYPFFEKPFRLTAAIKVAFLMITKYR